MCGKVFSKPLSKSVGTRWSSSTHPSSRPTAQRPGQKRGTGRRYWPLTRRSDEQGSRSCGRPLRLDIPGGQVHDSQMMDVFLDWATPPLAIAADKAYGSRKIRCQIADEGAVAVIPAKSNERQPASHDPNLDAQRNIVERFFCKMKDMRRLATRFEKKARNFLAMSHIFEIICWSN